MATQTDTATCQRRHDWRYAGTLTPPLSGYAFACSTRWVCQRCAAEVKVKQDDHRRTSAIWRGAINP